MRVFIVSLAALWLASGCFRGRLPVDEGADGEGEAAEGEGEGEGEGADVPDVACPGGPDCSAVLDDQPLLAGAAARDVTPTGFEIARYTYLTLTDDDACATEAPVFADGAHHCGVLKDNYLNDCGADGLCFTDPGYVAPDADGSERDELEQPRSSDYFLDCGRDRICPDNVAEVGADAIDGIDNDADGAIDDGAYVGPDSDGSEGDGVFQALWIAGYDNNRPAMGVKDPLQARAVVFRQGDSTLAVCTVDAVGLFFDEQERITERLNAAAPGEVDLFLLQATHTHEAPDTMGQWGESDPFGGIPSGPGRDEAHMELIREGCKDAVVEALAELVPVVMNVGRVNPGVDGLVRDSRDPFIVDDTITAISLEGVDDGAVVATIVNWGNHPEALDSDNNFISSDFVHGIRASIERGLPATATKPARPARAGTAIFWQGAVGGLLGPNGFLITGRDGVEYESVIKSWARSDALGENVAELAYEALDGAVAIANPRLQFSSKSYEADVENAVFHVGLINGWFDRKVFGYDPDVQIGPTNQPRLKTGAAVVKFGSELGFVTAPGELFPETFVGFASEQRFGKPFFKPDNPNPPDESKVPQGPYLRERLGVDFAFAMGLTQDEIGYLVEPYDYKLADGSDAYIEDAEGDHYEETNSIGPETVPAFMKTVDMLFTYEGARN